MHIKNVIFDFGNVLVKWDPYNVIKSIFPNYNAQEFYNKIHPIWLDLNLGKLTEQEAITLYSHELKFPEEKIVELMHKFKTSQTFIPGSLELLKNLYNLEVPLYAITDNTKGIIDYHHTHSNFLHYFKGIVVSANIGILKPNEQIYRYLLQEYNLKAMESVFIDDVAANVEGALSVGMHAFQFTNASSCKDRLIGLGFKL